MVVVRSWVEAITVLNGPREGERVFELYIEALLKVPGMTHLQRSLATMDNHLVTGLPTS